MIQGTTSNSGLTNDGSPMYPPGTSVYVGSYLVVASSPEELAQLLNYLSSTSKKPIDELTCTDINLGLVSEGLATKDLSTDPPIIALTPKGENYLTNFNNQQYFGDHLPFYSDSITNLQSHPFDKSATGAELDYELSGIQSTVQSIYAANYPEGTNDPLLTPEQISALPQDTVELIHQLFGPSKPLTQGQLNVLKLLGYVNGKPTDLSSWALTEDNTGPGSGKDLLAAFKDPNHRALIPSETSYNADDIGSSAQIVDAYFNADGSGLSPTYATDNPDKLKQILDMIKLQVKGLVEATYKSNEPKLSGVNIDNDTRELMNSLLGKDPSNAEFTASEVNVLASLGFVHFDPSTNTVGIENPGRGATTLNAERTVAAHDAEVEKQKQAEEQEKQRKTDFNNAIVTLSDPLAIEVMDYLEWCYDHKHANPTNGRFYLQGVWLLANLKPTDHVWEDIAPGTTVEQRQAMIDAAKTAYKLENRNDLMSMATDSANGHAAFRREDFGNYLIKNGLAPKSRTADSHPNKYGWIRNTEWHQDYYG